MSEKRPAYTSLAFTQTFLTSLCGKDFSAAERKAFVKALGLLEGNEKHPSLRVHELQGDLAGMWSASASNSLRMTFIRNSDGRKTLLTCSRHYAVTT